MSGFFVTFEGGEGSGKSTQIVRLERRLRSLGLSPLVTREPGGTPLAERVRDVLLEGSLSPPPLAEALLMEAARADLVHNVIRPALAASRIVLCDRYADSTLAYQGAGRGLDAALLARLNAIATGGLDPDLTLLFDLEAHAGLARRAGAEGALNRLDRESPEFHVRVRAKYLELAREHPARFVVLDASRDADALGQDVWAALEPRLARAVL
jgi:dTMP kinase